MRKCLAHILFLFVTIVHTLPEPPSPSYQYNPTIGSVSVPSGSYGAPSSSAPSSNYGPPSTQYGAPAQMPVVHKHVYVHVPPPEPEYSQPSKPIVFPPPQKHYKIVFIKAPAPPAPTAPVIPQAPQNEEKTLVYVLVKKPDEQPDIVIPTPSPTQPSKPEVYFIRYKTQKQETGTGPYPNSIASPSTGDYGAPPTSPIAQPPSSEYGSPL